MKKTYMTARSLFDTYFNIGMTASEAYAECIEQGIFSEEELDELKEVLHNGVYRI